MTFRWDERGRIPFAFLGALLLISSTLYATTAAPPAVTDPVSDEVIDQAQTNARMSLDVAIRTAGTEAAANPVLEPAETRYGELLSEGNTFREYLRLLIALQARERLDAATASRGSLGANVSLPPIDSRAAAAAALGNVSLTAVDEDRYRVQVTGLDVTLRRHGRVVDTFQYNTSLTVAIPALELHDRTTAFESRLDAGLTSPGLNRALTTRLFAITWARGYAQYGGAPIANVLANRHIEAMTNDALLAQQAAVFGSADRDGRNATRRAATNVALRDGFRGAEEGVKGALSSVQDQGDSDRSPTGTPSLDQQSVSVPSVYDQEQSYNVDRTADEAFLAFVDGSASPDLDRVLDQAYRAEVRATSRASQDGSSTSHAGQIPPNASLVWTEDDTDRWLSTGSWTDSGNGDTLREFHGTVVVEHTTTRIWASNSSLGRTTTTRRSTYDVSMDLRYRYDHPGVAPERPVQGSPFGSRTHDRLTSRSMSVVRAAGGTEALALGAVAGEHGTGWESVDLPVPDRARERAYERTAGLRDEVRDVSVSMETRSIASSANPASRLAATLDDRRGRMLDIPVRYGSAPAVAAAASRTVYLRLVTDRLRSKSPLMDRAQQALAERLQAHAIPTAPPTERTRGRSRLASRIDAEPAYLSLAARGDEPAMAARNVNIFAVPYGDAADLVSETLGGVGTSSVSLRVAAQTLRAVESGSVADGSSGPAVETLRHAIGRSLDDARASYRAELSTIVGRETARTTVRAAFDRFEGPRAQAIAVTNGQMASAIADALPADVDTRSRDRVRVEARVVSKQLREDRSIRISESLVEDVTPEAGGTGNPVVAESTKAAGTAGAKTAWKRATDKAPSSLPAGLPLLPVPGSWYATANAWTVSVTGSYDRFAVHAKRVSPGRNRNGTIEYVRTAETVGVDLDGDGRAETLGRNRPIAFEADTGVLIVVPPGKSGVGDVDGNMDERSPGWGG